MSLPVLRILTPFYRKYEEQLLYLFFGVLTVLLNLCVFWLAVKFCSPLRANVAAWLAGVLFAYATNRIWVFRSRSDDIARELLSFSVGRLATLGLEETILWLGISVLDFNMLIVKILAQVLVIIGNYAVSKWLVFQKKEQGG